MLARLFTPTRIMRPKELGLRWLLTLAAPLAGVALAGGCRGMPMPARNDSGLSQPATYVYACPDGYRFSARTRGDSVVVILPARALTLRRVVSASNARYETSGAAFWTNGDQASLETDATRQSDCQGARAGTPWEEAALVGVEFRAVGQEPGWTLDLDQGRWLRFIGGYGATWILTPAPAPVRDSALGSVTYTAQADGHTLVATIREAPCQDIMSGERFSHTVTVRADERDVKGCGRPLPTGDLVNTYWKLTQLGSVAAVPPHGQREAHLRIDLDGRQVMGSTGCNTLHGPVVIDKQRIRLGPIVTTRVACADTSLARQERQYVGALEGADQFTVADGHLTLYGNDRPLARFVVVHLR
jgi:putative lipoprotein